ncbi:hypothetical protein GW891_00570 [bacterium]|nr:hypothetical protein [bacterium]
MILSSLNLSRIFTIEFGKITHSLFVFGNFFNLPEKLVRISNSSFDTQKLTAIDNFEISFTLHSFHIIDT